MLCFGSRRQPKDAPYSEERCLIPNQVKAKSVSNPGFVDKGNHHVSSKNQARLPFHNSIVSLQVTCGSDPGQITVIVFDSIMWLNLFFESGLGLALIHQRS